ncbi:MAG: 5'-methylthioadenosine/adenosylhomocysteine nucleosidase [Clostridiales bacterium]|jgi:adenosylhomocysteine nucleosidase|nr:5'-methylthioadenosine/adenosylhomocysteine nucleosidase [Clostridiales bacterium]
MKKVTFAALILCAALIIGVTTLGCAAAFKRQNTVVGIIGAMDIEVEGLKSALKNPRAKTVTGIEFVGGTIGGVNVVIAKCGIGKVQAAMCAAIMIGEFNAKKIINTGVAGAVYSELLIGDVVVSSDTCQYDIEHTATGEPLGKLPDIDTVYFPADKTLIRLAEDAGKSVLKNNKLYVGTIATGDRFVADKETKKFIRDNFGGYAAEMEGGAIGAVCYLNKIPYVVIRAVSDNADETAGGEYEFSAESAAQNSIAIVKEMLKNLRQL